MVVDPQAAEFFKRAREDAANTFCMDCGTEGADWASVSHGVYLSIGASGIHRSLGVRVSFVQSTSMDSWKPVHLRMMELGGNSRFAAFLREHDIPEDMPLREKYRTRAAAWYRQTLRAEAEEAELPPPLERGTGHLLAEGQPDHTMAVLDQVFANAPSCGEMTRGGVPQSYCSPSSRHRAKKPGQKSSPSSLDWMAKQITKMTTSKGIRVAEKLRTMSTGSMQGFGHDGEAKPPKKKESSRGSHKGRSSSADPRGPLPRAGGRSVSVGPRMLQPGTP